MKFATVFVFGLCAVLTVSVWAEDEKGPARKGPGGRPGAGARRPGGPGGEAMREQLLKRFDKDGDGKLSDEERAAAMKERGGRPGAPGAGGRPGGPGGAGLADLIKKFDKDGDGKLSDAEKTAAREAMPKGGPGRRPGGKGKKAE